MSETAQLEQAGHRDRHQGGYHHEPLHHVGVGDREEATDQGVEHRDACHQDHAQAVVRPEGGLEEPTARHHAAGDVEGEEHQDDHARADLDQP